MGLIIKDTAITGDKGSAMVQALFDTGSSVSFLRLDIAENIATIVTTPSTHTFTLADGKGTLQVGQTVNLDIGIGEVTVFFTLFVLRDLAEELIIGADMLHRWKIRLDPEQEEVSVDPRASRLRL